MAPEQALGKARRRSSGSFLARRSPVSMPRRPVAVRRSDARRVRAADALRAASRPLDQLAPATPASVRDIVKACLQRDPAKRPERATIVAETLQAGGRRASAPERFPSPRPPPRRYRGGRSRSPCCSSRPSAVVVGARGNGRRRPAEDNAPRALVPAVTWPSAESDALISPDGKWLSFISDKQNQRAHLHPGDRRRGRSAGGNPRSGRQPRLVAGRPGACRSRPTGERPLSHGGAGVLRRITAPEPSARPHASTTRRSCAGSATACTWTSIAGSGDTSLVHAALATGTMDDVSGRWPRPFRYRTIDISPVTQTIVMDAAIDGRPDLWTSKVDGSNLRPLTQDAFVERHPMWSCGRSVVVRIQPRRPDGSLAVVDVEPAGDAADVESDDGGADRRRQLTGRSRSSRRPRRVNLWSATLASRSVHQLTGDALSDYWPSVNRQGSRIAFQRARPTPAEGYQFIDARVMVADTTRARTLEPQVVADGFGAKLSPDGSLGGVLPASARRDAAAPAREEPRDRRGADDLGERRPSELHA